MSELDESPEKHTGTDANRTRTDGGLEIETGSAENRLLEARKQASLAAHQLDGDLAAEAQDIAERVEWLLCELLDVDSFAEVVQQ